MRIGIVGAGMIGGTLGRLWRTAGHEVRFGHERPERIAALTLEIGAAGGTAAEAASFADVLLLAVPLKAVPELAQDLDDRVAGKVVIDANNAYAERDGDVARVASAYPGGSSSWLAALVPAARVVKAFNTVYFQTLLDRAHRGELGIPIAGDDPAAVTTAERLVEGAGFVPVVVGALAEGKRFEPGTAVYNKGLDAQPLARMLGVGN